MSEIVYLAADLTTGTIREEIPFFSAVTVGEVLNGVSSFSGSVPLTAATPNKITKANLALGDTILWVLSNGVPIWGGILWDDRVDVDNRSVTFSGLDFLSYFKKRVLTSNKNFNGTNAFTAMQSVLDSLQADAGGSIGTTLNTVGTPGNVTANFRAGTKTFGYDIFERLSVDGGFDFTCTWGGTQQALTHTITCEAPGRGRKTSVEFDLNSPSKAFKSVTSSAWDRVNRAHAINTGSNDKLAVVRSDSGNISASRLFEGVFIHSEVTSYNRMLQHANTDLQANVVNRETVTVEVAADDKDAGLGVLIVGDIVRVVAMYGYMDINRMFRVAEKQHRIATSGEITIVYTLQDARLYGDVS